MTACPAHCHSILSSGEKARPQRILGYAGPRGIHLVQPSNSGNEGRIYPPHLKESLSWDRLVAAEFEVISLQMQPSKETAPELGHNNCRSTHIAPPPSHCMIVVAIVEPFPLFSSLPIGQHILTLLGYITTSWLRVHLAFRATCICSCMWTKLL